MTNYPLTSPRTRNPWCPVIFPSVISNLHATGELGLSGNKLMLLLEERGPLGVVQEKYFRDTHIGGVLSDSGKIYQSKK